MALSHTNDAPDFPSNSKFTPPSLLAFRNKNTENVVLQLFQEFCDQIPLLLTKHPKGKVVDVK